MVLNLKNIIVKRIACFILIILIIFTSSYHKKVEAVFVIDDVALLYLGGAIITTMAAAGIISASQNITTADIEGIKNKLSDASDDVISGINNLGISIKNGADLAVTQAKASGASVYAVLSAIQSVLFPSIDNPNIPDTFEILAINDTYTVTIDIEYEASFYDYYDVYGARRLGVLPSKPVEAGTSESVIFWKIYNNSDNSLYNNGNAYLNTNSDESIYYYAFNYVGLCILFDADSYSLDAVGIPNVDSISIPASVPDVIGTSIDSYVNGNNTEDLIITLPTDYVLPSDLVIVDPETVATDTGVDTGENSGELESTSDEVTSGDIGIIGTISAGITSIIDLITAETTETIDTSKLEGLNALIFDKFPFCIPFDLYHFFQLLSASPEAPNFSFPFSLPGGFDTDLVIDFSGYDAVGAFIRNINYILFVIFLMYSTKKLIWK